MFYLRSSDHGNKRRHQRCSSKEVFEALLLHFDRDVDVGGGASAISVSDEYLEKLLDDGVVTLAVSERLKGLAVIIQTDYRGATIKTVVRGRFDDRFGRYVRPRKKSFRYRH